MSASSLVKPTPFYRWRKCQRRHNLPKVSHKAVAAQTRTQVSFLLGGRAGQGERRRKRTAIPQEALLVVELEDVQIEGLPGPGLHAGEAEAHVDTGVQVLQGQPVHPGQEALAQPLHQLPIHLWYFFGKRTGQVRLQSQATSKELFLPN